MKVNSRGSFTEALRSDKFESALFEVHRGKKKNIP